MNREDLSSAPPARSSEGDDDPRRRIAAAVERAADSGKRVLVVFAADWCGDSRALEETFRHYLLVPLLQAGFETITLDVGDRDRHLEIAKGWGIDYESGIPTVAVLDGRGELVAATTEGELASARALSPIQVATLLHRWLPDHLREG